jgi:hypothetical protein
MRSCLVCKNTKNFHVFPKEESTLQRWMRNLNLRSRPSPSAVICENHFHASDIVKTMNGYNKLKPGAVPTQNRKRNFDHTYSRDHRDPYSGILSLLIMLTPVLCCWLPLLVVFFYSVSELNHRPCTGTYVFFILSFFMLMVCDKAVIVVL